MPRSAASEGLESNLRAQSLPVLARAGEAGPVFGDDYWDLSGAGLPARVRASDAWLNFGSIADPHWRLMAKEYFWARLNEPVEGSRLLPPQSARAEFAAFSLFCRWMLDPGAHPSRFRPTLSSLNRAHLDSFVQALRDGYTGRPLAAGTLGIYLRLVERLYDYSGFFSHDGLAFHPWRHRSSWRIAGGERVGENKRPRIPPDVLGPFLRWCLFYVEVASRDILAGLAELERLRCNAAVLLPSGDEMSRRIEEWAAARRARRQGVPSRRRSASDAEGADLQRGANLTVIAEEAGLSPGSLRRPDLRRQIGDLVLVLGPDEDRTSTVRLPPMHWVTNAKVDVLSRLERYIDDRGRAGRGIPCWSERSVEIDGMANMSLIAAQLGVAPMQAQHNPEAFAIVRGAVGELGGEPGGMDTEISIDAETGRPWRSRFGPNSVVSEAAHLRAACYVVCAYLSGMRDGEIMEIRPGAGRLERSADGVVNRHRVASVVSKGRRTPEPATWVVTEQAVRALEVMERLDRSDLVFDRFSVRLSRINELRAHINELAANDPSLGVPDVGGAPWRFDTRQFRRTLAWFIGSQPFGVWAGAVQFKHRSVRSAMEGIGPTVLEGYVGTRPSGFPAEVDLAKAAAADLYVENLAAAHAGGAASGGPGARRINAELEELRGDVGASGETGASPRPVDGQRRAAMLRSVSRNLFVGPLTDCFFDPDVALCLRDHDRSAATAPIVGRCQPERCRNSRIGDHHLGEWEDRLAQLRRDLRTRGLPPIQKRHLADQRDRLAAAVAEVRAGRKDGT